MDDTKLREILTALLEEMRNSKVQISDVLAQRSEYAADIRDLKTALDPKALAEHVADNNDAFLGDAAQVLAKGVQINQDVAKLSIQTAKDLDTKLTRLDSESRAFASITSRLEERDSRSIWDFATLAAGMLIAALLAGGAADYFTKQKLDNANFQNAIQLIQNDDDAYWCGSARASIVQDNQGTHYCAIAMPKYQIPEENEGE